MQTIYSYSNQYAISKYIYLMNKQQSQSRLSLDQKDHPRISFKIVVLGESFVGKTSLIQKFVKQNYSSQYSVTVGAEFNSKSMLMQNTIIQLQIWDTCGHDLFRSVTSSFYRGACAVFLVFALDNKQSFQKINFWFDQFKQNGSPEALVFLIGTKSDCRHQVTSDQGMQFMKKLGGIMYVETSAQTGQQIQQLFYKTGEFLYKKYKISHSFRVLSEPRKHNSSILLDPSSQENNADLKESKWKKKCC